MRAPPTSCNAAVERQAHRAILQLDRSLRNYIPMVMTDAIFEDLRRHLTKAIFLDAGIVAKFLVRRHVFVTEIDT